MGRLDRLKLIAEIANTVTTAGATVFDRLRHVKELSEKVEELEKQVKELKEKK